MRGEKGEVGFSDKKLKGKKPETREGIRKTRKKQGLVRTERNERKVVSYTGGKGAKCFMNL